MGPLAFANQLVRRACVRVVVRLLGLEIYASGGGGCEGTRGAAISVRDVAHRLCDPVRDRPHGVSRGFRGTVGSLGSGTRCDIAELPGRLSDLVGHSLNFGTTAQLASPRLHALVRALDQYKSQAGNRRCH